MNRVPITVQIESFEGPLDLLLHLIQTHELDISQVSISRITDQYLVYVRVMQELNFDFASEFLVMAATLLHWKSQSILPREGDELPLGEDEERPLSPEDLIRQLLEHQRFLAAGQDLAQQPKLGEDVFTRQNTKPPVERVWRAINVTELALSFQDTLIRARKRKTVLRKETVSLSEKILEFSEKLELNKPLDIRQLLSALPSRTEWVVTFLATLELARLKKLRLYQNETYTPIFIELIESLLGFDLQLASGFDYQTTMADKAKTLSVPEEIPLVLETPSHDAAITQTSG